MLSGAEELQYTEAAMSRDVLKAAAAFRPANQSDSSIPVSVQASWGCGTYSGEPQLKLVLLWLAASMHQRVLSLHTASENQAFNAWDLEALSVKAVEMQLTIAEIWRLLLLYCRQRAKRPEESVGALVFVMGHLADTYGAIDAVPGQDSPDLTPAQSQMRAEYMVNHTRSVLVQKQKQLKELKIEVEAEEEEVSQLAEDAESADAELNLAEKQIARSKKEADNLRQAAAIDAQALARAQSEVERSNDHLKNIQQKLSSARRAKRDAAAAREAAEKAEQDAVDLATKHHDAAKQLEVELKEREDELDRACHAVFEAESNPVKYSRSQMDALYTSKRDAEAAAEATRSAKQEAAQRSEASATARDCSIAATDQCKLDQHQADLALEQLIADESHAKNTIDAAERAHTAIETRRSLGSQRATAERASEDEARAIKEEMAALRGRRQMEVDRRREVSQMSVSLAEEDLAKAKARHEQAVSNAAKLEEKRRQSRQEHVKHVEAKVETNSSATVKQQEAIDEAKRKERAAKRAEQVAKKEEELERIYAAKQVREERADQMSTVRETARKAETRERHGQFAAREAAMPLFAQISRWLDAAPTSGTPLYTCSLLRPLLVLILTRMVQASIFNIQINTFAYCVFSV